MLGSQEHGVRHLEGPLHEVGRLALQEHAEVGAHRLGGDVALPLADDVLAAAGNDLRSLPSHALGVDVPQPAAEAREALAEVIVARADGVLIHDGVGGVDEAEEEPGDILDADVARIGPIHEGVEGAVQVVEVVLVQGVEDVAEDG